MENSIQTFYEGSKTPVFLIEDGEIIWKNKAANNIDKSKKIGTENWCVKVTY